MKLSFNRTIQNGCGFVLKSVSSKTVHIFLIIAVFVGKLIENEILHLVVQDENEVKLLVLAKKHEKKMWPRTDCCRHGVCREVSEWRNAQMPEKKKVRSCSKR